MTCPLCKSSKLSAFCADEKRSYLQCGRCDLIFTPASYHLSAHDEKAQYDHHENDPTDTGYRQFLSRVTVPLLDQLPPQSAGLDFGCGPGPTLSLMLEEAGHTVALYDKFYHRDEALLAKPYDFITMTEVAEHLDRPDEIFDQLWACVKPKGILAIMTKRAVGQADFKGWYYKNDPTHICFYTARSFEWLAEKLGATLQQYGPDVVFLIKSDV